MRETYFRNVVRKIISVFSCIPSPTISFKVVNSYLPPLHCFTYCILTLHSITTVSPLFVHFNFVLSLSPFLPPFNFFHSQLLRVCIICPQHNICSMQSTKTRPVSEIEFVCREFSYTCNNAFIFCYSCIVI